MKAERIVAQEIVESNKMRGQKEKTILEGWALVTNCKLSNYGIKIYSI